MRRESLFAELAALGADACVVDGPDLAAKAQARTGGAPSASGLTRSRAGATTRIATCLAEGGVVCNYGSTCGEDPVMLRGALTSTARSSWASSSARGLASRSLAEIRALYADLGGQLLDGRPRGAGRADLSDRGDLAALVDAQRGERTGKILVAPNGAIQGGPA